VTEASAAEYQLHSRYQNHTCHSFDIEIIITMSDSTPEQKQFNNTPTEFEEDGVFVALTHDTLDAVAIMNKVRSPKAGAIVLFAGTI
jgi:hypothetical protein